MKDFYDNKNLFDDLHFKENNFRLQNNPQIKIKTEIVNEMITQLKKYQHFL